MAEVRGERLSILPAKEYVIGRGGWLDEEEGEEVDEVEEEEVRGDS